VRPVLVEVEAGSRTRVRVKLTARRDFPFLGAMTDKPAERSAEAMALIDAPASLSSPRR
jgi:hypothetical protein